VLGKVVVEVDVDVDVTVVDIGGLLVEMGGVIKSAIHVLKLD